MMKAGALASELRAAAVRAGRGRPAWIRGGLHFVEFALWKIQPDYRRPPHSQKVAIVLRQSRLARTQVFIETGTYYGDMISAVCRRFREVYSIELNKDLYIQGMRRFSRRRNVHIILGDSARVLPTLITGLREPTTFWLDAHYSGVGTARGTIDPPILQEIDSIVSAAPHGHLILIDDAQCFGGATHYPSVTELAKLVEERRPGTKVVVESNVISIRLPQSGADDRAIDPDSTVYSK